LWWVGAALLLPLLWVEREAVASGITTLAYNLIQEDGASLTRRSTLNFTGTAVTCSDVGGKTECAVTGGGGAAITANYSQAFVAQTSVALAHSLGTTAVVVQCYNAGAPPVGIGWDTLTLNSTTTATVTFTGAQSGTCVVNGAGGAWLKYTVATKAVCVSTNPCWTVNAVEGADLAAGLTQDVTVVQLAANGFVDGIRLKTAVAFTGTTTLTATLGTATNNLFYLLAPYDLMAAVSATTFSPATGYAANLGSTTTAAVNVVLGITSTVQNIDQLAAVKSVDVWLRSAVLP
jgi:hypothetical protein